MLVDKRGWPRLPEPTIDQNQTAACGACCVVRVADSASVCFEARSTSEVTWFMGRRQEGIDVRMPATYRRPQA
jgi:hypothetical protein